MVGDDENGVVEGDEDEVVEGDVVDVVLVVDVGDLVVDVVLVGDVGDLGILGLEPSNPGGPCSYMCHSQHFLVHSLNFLQVN